MANKHRSPSGHEKLDLELQNTCSTKVNKELSMLLFRPWMLKDVSGA
jgi:hypothetical protein